MNLEQRAEQIIKSLEMGLSYPFLHQDTIECMRELLDQIEILSRSRQEWIERALPVMDLSHTDNLADRVHPFLCVCDNCMAIRSESLKRN